MQIKNDIFIISHLFNVKIYERGDEYVVRRLDSYWDYERKNHAICSIEDKYILVTGGEGKFEGYTCEIYNIESEKWKGLAELNEGRLNHASCSIGSTAYVFCGFGYETDDLVYSIESLDTRNRLNRWQMINYSDSTGGEFGPRICLGVAALNKNEIIICGGHHCGKDLADIFIFNVSKKTMRRICKNNEKAICPSTYPCVLAQDGVVLTANQDNDQIIQINVQAETVRVIDYVSEFSTKDSSSSFELD